MKKNWLGWMFALLYLSGVGIFAFSSFEAWRAIHSGGAPLQAFQASQERFWHILLNPWVFTTYLFILLVLIWNALRAVVKKQRQPNDLWFLGALLASIGVLLFRFIQRQ
jgi:uncharacterized BrkB/YihY/UPF0761 family membrane protein